MQKRELKIGLTGGIGSGKSTVAKIINTMGYPVYYSDSEASRIVNCDPVVRKLLISRFGSDIYRSDRTLNKPLYASIIFNDPEALAYSNSIIHPAVIRDFHCWCNRQNSCLLFFESAIIFEAGLTAEFDEIILVYADEEIRITRVMKRDNTPEERVRERIKNQYKDPKEKEMARFKIHNNDNDMILPQIIEIIQQLNIESDATNDDHRVRI